MKNVPGKLPFVLSTTSNTYTGTGTHKNSLSLSLSLRDVLTRLTGRCYCLLCAFLRMFAGYLLFECCVSYYCVRHGMEDILVCLLCIDATGIQSNMRVFVSTLDC